MNAGAGLGFSEGRKNVCEIKRKKAEYSCKPEKQRNWSGDAFSFFGCSSIPAINSDTEMNCNVVNVNQSKALMSTLISSGYASCCVLLATLPASDFSFQI